jgi:hypothetical protein
MGAMTETPKNQREPIKYLAYLLRLWRVRGDGEEGTGWRALLKSPLTGEQHGFASLEELCEFLRRQTRVMPEDDESRSDIDA